MPNDPTTYGQLVLGTATFMLMAARAGFGLAHLPEEGVRSDLESGRLVRVLADWFPAIFRYHLYCPSRRQPTQAFCPAGRSATLSRQDERRLPPALVRVHNAVSCGVPAPM
jgi:DNA-binding transcriptional LysR family regulator